VSNFRTCFNRGFHITFDNGVTLSTQIGAGTYSDNHDEPFDFEKPRKSWDADEVEVAIWKGKNNWITKEYTKNQEGDSVIGWVKFDEWLKIFDWCRNYEVTK
jgi:hypothetical protein